MKKNDKKYFGIDGYDNKTRRQILNSVDIYYPEGDKDNTKIVIE